MSCHLLYLDARHLLAFAWNKGQLQPEGEFIADENGSRNFASYLAQRSHGHFHLLVTLSDEDYASESIPHLWGKDRQALIERKTRQHFPEPALNMVLSLGYEKTPRKKENLLISALTEPEQLEPWLLLIKQAEAALSGIYSSAQLSGQLLKKLGYDASRCLLLCRFGHSLCESYLDNGHTIFSRLITIKDDTVPAFADSLVTEAGMLHQYLIGRRRIAHDASLPVFVIAHPQVTADLERATAKAENLAFKIIDNHAVARRLKLKALPEDSCCTPLFLHLLANKQPQHQYASREIRQVFRLTQSRRLIWALGFGTLLASSMNVANDIQQTWTLNAERAQLADEEQSLQRRQQEIATRLPKIEISHESLRQITDLHTELANQQDRFAPALTRLGQALDQVTDIELEKLAWHLEKSAPDTGVAVAQEVIDLSGFIQKEKMASGRQALSSLERLTELLRSTPNSRVDIVKPLFVTTSAGAPDDTGEETESPLRQHFSLRIAK